MASTACTGSISDSDFNFIAQMAHWLGGSFAILIAVRILGRWCMWIVAVLFLTFFAVKEWWYDTNYEDCDERGSNLIDWLFYLLGVVIGILTILITDWTHSARVIQKCICGPDSNVACGFYSRLYQGQQVQVSGEDVEGIEEEEKDQNQYDVEKRVNKRREKNRLEMLPLNSTSDSMSDMDVSNDLPSAKRSPISASELAYSDILPGNGVVKNNTKNGILSPYSSSSLSLHNNPIEIRTSHSKIIVKTPRLPSLPRMNEGGGGDGSNGDTDQKQRQW